MVGARAARRRSARASSRSPAAPAAAAPRRDARRRCARSPPGRALRPAGHLTCVGRSRAEIDAAIARYWAAGVRHIVALRGDMPELGAPFAPHPDGYASSIELIDGDPRGSRRSRSASRPTPSRTPTRARCAERPRACSRARRTPARLARSRSSASTTEAIVRLRDRVDRAGIDLADRPGDHARRRTSTAVARMARALRREHPGLAGGAVRRPRATIPQTRKLLAAIVAAAQVEELRREGFERVPLLHAQPGRRGRRRLPAARPRARPTQGARAA